MKNRFAAVMLGLVLAVTTAGQQRPPIVAFGSDSPERGTTRVGYWSNEKNVGVGEFAIDYGKPIWKKAYDEPGQFDRLTKGKVWRLGENFWTVLDTNIPLKISGKEIPIGSWYLGLHRTEDGSTWSLAFIDPSKARKARLDAFQVDQAPIEFKVPIKLEQQTDLKERLAIDLIFKKETFKDVTLVIAWGKLKLTAPIEITLAG